MEICISGVTHRKFPFFFQWLAYIKYNEWFLQESQMACVFSITIFVSRPLLCYSILNDPLRLNYRKFCWQNPTYGNSTIKLTLKWQCKIPLPAFWGIHEKRRGKKVAKGVPAGLFLLQEKKSHRHVASIGLLWAIHIWSSIKCFQVYIINKLEKC